MTDAFGRTMDYLRVSVTDRCNLRCVYCMPRTGADFMPQEEILSFEEILRLCRIFAELGIRKVKVTGGEPLVRRGVTGFIKALKEMPQITKVTLTSNGALLPDHLDGLAQGGLDGVNISLDALSEKTFSRITQGGSPGGALMSIDRARALGLPVKVNCVPVLELNPGEITGIAALARDRDIAVRFIEMMPLGGASAYHFIASSEIKALLEREYGALTPFSGSLGNGPAEYYGLKGFRGKLGFISAVSHKFCGECNRLRLTAFGLLKTCIAFDGGLDLKAMLRGGAPDAAITREILGAVEQKPRSHAFSEARGTAAGLFRTGG